jgi:signal transduction histidine kinase
VWVNQTFLDQTGYPKEEVVGRNCRFLQRDDRDQPGRYDLRRAVDSLRPTHALLRNYTASDERFYNEVHVSPVPDDRDRATHLVGVQRATPPSLARALADHPGGALGYARDLVTDAQAARQAARAADISEARSTADAIEQSLLAEQHRLSNDAGRLTQLLSELVGESRAVSMGQALVESGPGGLAAALGALVAKTGVSGPECAFSVEGGAVRDPRRARHLYRIAEELIENALAHAAAARIEVALRGGDGEPVRLSVRDDGDGLPSRYQDDPLAGDGHGFHRIHLRASMSEADLDFVVPEGGGTQVEIILEDPDAS